MAHVIEIEQLKSNTIVLAASDSDKKELKMHIAITEATEVIIYKIYVAGIYVSYFFDVQAAIAAYNTIGNEQ